MEGIALNYFLEGEAPQGTAQRMEEEARKTAQQFKFSEALTSPQPAKAWQVTINRLLAGAVLVPEFHREHGLNSYLASQALERLEHLERFTLRPLEFEAGQGEGLAAFDTAQQVASAKAFLEEVRAALKAEQFSPLCWGDFDVEGNARFTTGTAGGRTFETDVKGRPWPDTEEHAEFKAAWELLQDISREKPGTAIFADRASFEKVHWPKLARLKEAWLKKKENAPSEEQFREALGAEFEVLEGQTKAAFSKWNPDKTKPLAGHIGLPEGWELDNSPEAQAYFHTFLANTLSREFLTAVFLPDEGPSRPASPPAFNPEEVEALLKEAFERLGVYSDGVQIVTKNKLKAYLKAAFRVLVERGIIPPESQKAFEEFSKKAFPPGITSRTAYGNPKEDLMLELFAVIPKKFLQNKY